MLSRLRQAIEIVSRPRVAAVLAAAMTIFFAAADFTAPGEINVAIFYALSVAAAGWSRSRRLLWLMTGICCVLSIAGLALGPQPRAELVSYLYINRTFVAFGLVIMAAIVEQRMHMLGRLEAARDLEARQNALLSDSEAQVRATFDQAAVGIALSDLTGRFFQVNERLCAITGYSRDELLARRYQDITYPDDVERNRQLNERLIAGEFPHFRLEKRYLRRDGSTYWINVTSAVVRRASGEPDYVIAVIEDISERKRVEAELHRVNAELERRVELEVARRLEAEQSLHQAQKMEAIGQLTGGVAHDFNNILTTVIGNLDRIAGRMAPEDPSRRLAEAALRGAENGARLTEQLLSFARRQRLQPEVLDIDHVLGSAIALARRTVSETIELSLELGADLWRCCVDPAQLQSAVLNLVINARDAMRDGGRITIAARNETVAGNTSDLVAGDYVRLSVADTGSGMTPEVLARVFEPFFTTKQVGEGSGLGLSMVYGFARQSGGAVRIESAPGRGTVVQLYLPRTTMLPARNERTSPPPMPRAERPATVLIVEDEEDVRQLAAESLEEFGYRVLLAENAPAAVSVLERDTVDLLLSDIVMPGGMSGLELADRARRLHCALPVLLTTGYAEAIDHAVARRPSIELLRKPFRPRELGAKVQQMLSAAAGQ
ncbi:MAG TPA: PAS domain S-box protein [Stellaceae bacterium]|nr:PAS domain S-box protein [Stellaceae bacterium]